MSLTYRPFDYSTGVVAGYHTGSAQFVDKDFADRRVVHFHEGVHDRIFNETPDGQFHLFCLRAAAMADSLAAEAMPLARWLSSDTRIAQERAATYLGVSSLDPADGAVEATQLVPEYAEYYQFFVSLLGAHVRSTYARYAFAWAISAWAFSSRRLERLAHDDWFDIAKVRAIEGPTSRMDRVAEAARHRDFGEVIRGCISTAGDRVARQGIQWADIDDEQEWVRASGSQNLHVVDIALHTAMTTWLHETFATGLFAWGQDSEAAILARLKRVNLTPRLLPDSSEAEADFLAELSDRQRLTGSRREARFVLTTNEARRAINVNRRRQIYVTAVIAPGDVKRPFIVHLTSRDWEQVRTIGASPFRMTYGHFCGLVRTLQRRRTPIAPVALLYELGNARATWILQRLTDHRRLPFRMARSFASANEWRRRVPVMPFAVVQKNWTRILRVAPGRLMKLTVDLQSASGDQPDEFVVSCLFPPHPGQTPMINISGLLTDGLRRPLEAALSARGLESVKVTDPQQVPLLYQLLFMALWDNLGESSSDHD